MLQASTLGPEESPGHCRTDSKARTEACVYTPHLGRKESQEHLDGS